MEDRRAVRYRYFLLWGIMAVLSVLTGTGCDTGPEKQVMQVESITISGSDSAYPAVLRLAEGYNREHPRDRIHFLPSGHSEAGVTGVVDGEAQIGVVSRELTLEEQAHALLRYPFARDMLVFATHPDVNVHEISSRELLNIFSGKIANWKTLGGADLEIVVLDRPYYTSAKIKLEETIFGEDFKVSSKAMVLERSEQVDETLQNVPGSIGYTAYSNLYAKGFDISILHLNGMMPSLERLQYSSTDVFREYAFVFKDRPQGLARRFVDFVYSSAGARILLSNGLAPDYRKFVVALVPAINIMEQETRYFPLIQYLSRKINVPIEVEYTAGYGEAVEGFLDNRFDGAFLGSFAYALINHRLPVEVLGRPEINGQGYYTGILFVRKDSGIQEFQDLRGKTACFVDKATAAGYLFPLLYFKEHGVNKPEDFLGKIIYSGSHDAAVLSVLNGEADVGFAKDLILLRAGEKDSRIALDLLMVAASPEIPTNGLCVRRTLDWDLKGDLKEALLGMDRDLEGQKVLKRFGADRFLSTSGKDYENFNTMLKKLEIDPGTFVYRREKKYIVNP